MPLTSNRAVPVITLELEEIRGPLCESASGWVAGLLAWLQTGDLAVLIVAGAFGLGFLRTRRQS